MKRLKNVGVAALLSALAFSGSMLLTSTDSSHSVDAVAQNSWKRQYTRALNNWRLVDEYSDTSYIRTYFGKDYKLNRYFLCDIDRNGTPELIMYSKNMLDYVWTYKNGELIGLGYYHISRINRKYKCIIEHGHWHGAGGSGVHEWQIYTLKSGNKIVGDKGIDYRFNGRPSKKYKRTYNKYVKNAKKFSAYKKYRLTNKRGLNNIQK